MIENRKLKDNVAMSTPHTDLIPGIPRITDNNAGAGNGLSLGSAVSGHSKAARLAEMMSKPETYEEIGSAWFLYLRLVLVEGGKMIGTYDDIGQGMGTVGKTIRNWVKTLEKAGIAKSETKGHHVVIHLLGKHMEIAKAQEEVIQVMSPDVTATTSMSLEMQNATKLLQAAEDAGAPIELRTVFSWKR